MVKAIQNYWNQHIHDLDIATHPVGSKAFFKELDAYRFEKLDYLPRIVDFGAYRDREFLEVGCGVGLDLAHFARGGARVTGVDLAAESIRLAQRHFAQQGLEGHFRVMNGESLPLDGDRFDVVYAHGVLQYTYDPERMISELHRVLKPGGKAIFMMYNRYSWLVLLSRVSGVSLEHDDAPAFHMVSQREFRRMLQRFADVEIIPERFPVPTRLHRGVKAMIYNKLFVNAFNLIPRALVRPLGWHLMARAVK